MPLKESEAIVLRTYLLREADLLVTLFTRAEGKIKGVAKSAKKSRRRFGGALEPLTCVRAQWEDRERQELARIDSCEVLLSPMSEEIDYGRAAALAHIGEMLDELMPDREVNDTVFRLAWNVLQHVHAGAIWMPITYFELWMVRLMGLLPGFAECIECGESLAGEKAYFHAMVDGLLCGRDKRLASSELSSESRAIAAEMFRRPVENLAGDPWSRKTGADLRKMLMQIVQRHAEVKLVTLAALDKVEQ
jgi:DNA repair protein RecO (recombination protein O)